MCVRAPACIRNYVLLFCFVCLEGILTDEITQPGSRVCDSLVITEIQKQKQKNPKTNHANLGICIPLLVWLHFSSHTERDYFVHELVTKCTEDTLSFSMKIYPDPELE